MLDYELNKKIIALAPKFIASEHAPDSFEKLKSNVGRLVVWSGASENTIYGEAAVNHAFRAWHDSLHLKLNAEFTPAGERLVALEQARIIGSEKHGLIMLAEIVGQAEYLAKHGSFPTDQNQFILNYMKGIL